MKISFDALSLAPALAPMVGALLVLVVDVVVPRRSRLPWIVTALTLIGAMAALVVDARFDGRRSTLCENGSCLWQLTGPGVGLAALALGSAFVVTLMALVERTQPTSPERASVRAMLVLSATAGCVGVVAARDLASWLVLIELATLPGVALVALRGGKAAAHGALTLLATALTSFAVLALGCALWFAATGSARMTGDQVLDAFSDEQRKPLVVVAMMLIIAGVGFKLSLAPFHAWTPEAFAGSGSWVAAFLATTSKVGALGAMLVVVQAASALGSSALTAVAIVSALSMTVGNVMALRQRDLLRLMAWSTVAQAGWVVLPMAAIAAGSARAAGQYLALYTLGTLAVFVVLAALERFTATLHLDDLRGLFRRQPLMAGTLALGLLALAGLPPSIVGVVAKVVALKPAVSAHLWWLVAVAVVNALLGVAVYLRWIVVMFTSERPAVEEADDMDLDGVALADEGSHAPRVMTASPGHATPSAPYTVLAGVMSLAIIVVSILPSLLLRAF